MLSNISCGSSLPDYLVDLTHVTDTFLISSDQKRDFLTSAGMLIDTETGEIHWAPITLDTTEGSSRLNTREPPGNPKNLQTGVTHRTGSSDIHTPESGGMTTTPSSGGSGTTTNPTYVTDDVTGEANIVSRRPHFIVSVGPDLTQDVGFTPEEMHKLRMIMKRELEEFEERGRMPTKMEVEEIQKRIISRGKTQLRETANYPGPSGETTHKPGPSRETANRPGPSQANAEAVAQPRKRKREDNAEEIHLKIAEFLKNWDTTGLFPRQLCSVGRREGRSRRQELTVTGDVRQRILATAGLIREEGEAIFRDAWNYTTQNYLMLRAGPLIIDRRPERLKRTPRKRPAQRIKGLAQRLRSMAVKAADGFVRYAGGEEVTEAALESATITLELVRDLPFNV